MRSPPTTLPQLKILHAACLNSAKRHPGIIKQMTYEESATKEIQAHWRTSIRATDREPKLSKNPLVRRLQFFLMLLRASKRFDYILIRYLPLDPFIALLALIYPGKILPVFHWIHKADNSIASRAEGVLLKLTLMVCPNIVAVTRGIGLQICEVFKIEKKRIFEYINGIDLNDSPIPSELKDNAEHPQIAFVASNFYPWHGLLELVNSIPPALKKPFTIHAIGELDRDLRNQISSTPHLQNKFKFYGSIAPEHLKRVLRDCDIGIGTLAPQHTKIKDACTLKTREYLAYGLPAYNGLPDVAFPKDFPFFKCGPASIDAILDFYKSNRNITKTRVRMTSEAFISKRSQILKLYNELKCLKCQTHAIL